MIMDEATIARLNGINREFYQTVADEFDMTRGKAWPGWSRALPSIQAVAHAPALTVLDVGCGNGRFGVFLAQRLKLPVDYHGIDSNAALLDHAGESLSAFRNLTTRLEQRDVLETPLPDATYDVVGLFGV